MHTIDYFSEAANQQLSFSISKIKQKVPVAPWAAAVAAHKTGAAGATNKHCHKHTRSSNQSSHQEELLSSSLPLKPPY
jgi:hypothetical protein